MKVPITIQNQHELLNLVAGMYKTLDRVIMEYIDNSFDNAFEHFYDEQSNDFTKRISIIVEIHRNQNKISVRDNCAGMDETKAKGLANSINDSNKKDREAKKRPWVNGQFGFGVHAFRGFANKLMVHTREKEISEYKIEIDRNNKDAEISKTLIRHFEGNASGTLVIIEDIERHAIKHISINLLQKEVEKHFEPLLNKNVEVLIKDSNSQIICEPFNYDSIDGFSINKKIERWIEKSPRGTDKLIDESHKPIFVHLKVCFDKIDRPPFFISRGRRINQISQMDSFISKTAHRKKVWDHYYLTGYIDINGHLEPIITRDDFNRGQARTAIYNEIIKLEDEIYQAIEAVNADKVDKNLQNFASQISNILTEIAKDDSYKLSQLSNTNEKMDEGEKKKIIEQEEGEDWLKKNKGTEPRPPHPPGPYQKEIVKGVENPEGVTDAEKAEKKKGNLFKIEFNKIIALKRSHYSEGLITIFTSHPDFNSRIAQSNKAELDQLVITARLTSYLSAIISSHYKEAFTFKRKDRLTEILHCSSKLTSL